MTPQKVSAEAEPGARVPWRYSHHAEILLVSFAALLIEISYTRIISYKLFYYYVYLVIGIALLGVGAGAVLVAVSKRIRSAPTDTVLFWSFILGAAATIASYVVIAHIQINTLAVWLYGTSGSVKSFLLLLILCLCLFASFVPAGIISATLFSRRPEGIGGLYFADLLGAAIACGAVIYIISSIGAPATVMLAATAMAAGAIWVGLRLGWALAGLAAVALVVGLVLTVGPGLLPSQRLDTSKTEIPPGTLAFSGWVPYYGSTWPGRPVIRTS